MAFKINFDEKKVEGGFSIVKEGKYEVTIVTAELKVWNDNQYSIGFDVEIRSDIEQEHQGAKVLYNSIYLTTSNPEFAESTERKRNAFFKACGYSGQQEIDVEKAIHEIVGKSVLAYVKHEVKGDKTYPRVKFVAPANVAPAQNTNGTTTVLEEELPF